MQLFAGVVLSASHCRSGGDVIRLAKGECSPDQNLLELKYENGFCSRGGHGNK
jgi:hypothetical protein